MPPAMVLVDTRPSSMAPPNSNIAAICRVQGAFRTVQACRGCQGVAKGSRQPAAKAKAMQGGNLQ